MPIKLQRSPLATSSALRRETGEVSDGTEGFDTPDFKAAKTLLHELDAGASLIR